MKSKTLVALFIALVTFNYCKKDEEKVEPTIDTPTNRIFTNISDPRLAEVITNDQRSITFFGGKDSEGKPTSLYAYRIKSLTDTSKIDVFTFDNLGRYSDVVFSNGSKVHFDYNNTNDSVFIAVSSSTKVDTIIALKYVRKPRGQRIGNFYSVQGKGDINVKVVAKNASTQAERDVTNAQVYVRISGNNFDYWNIAKNEGSGIYSVPIPGQFQTSVPTITKAVADFIINALEIACFSACDGCPSFAATLQPFCLQVSTVPYLGPLCAISTSSLVYLCEFGGDKIISNLLEKAVAYSAQHMAPDEAAVTIWAEHFQLGKSSFSQLAMSEVRFKNTTNEPYVSKLVYSELPVVGGWNFRFEWSNSVPVTTPITFSEDQSIFFPVYGTTGKWYLNGNNITFTLSSGNQYTGTVATNVFMSGTMKGGTNTGVWSANR